MNVQDVITRVLRRFGDEAQVQITEDDIIRYINDGSKEIAFKNEILQATGTMHIVAGRYQYPIPSDLLTLRTMYYAEDSLIGDSPNGSRIGFIEKTTYDEFINSDDPQRISQGIPQYYTRWANTFYLYPTPSQNVQYGLRLEYTQRPLDVFSVDDDLQLPQEYHSVIVDYCMQQAYETDEAWDAAGAKSQQVQNSINELAELTNFQNRQYFPVITILPEDM